MKIKLYDVGPKLTIEQVTEIEKTIGHQLPQQYKDFILQFNGGKPRQDCFKVQYNGQEWADNEEETTFRHLFFMTDDSSYSFLENYEDYKDRVPSDTIPIACDEGRSLLLLGIEGENVGKIFYWNGSYEVDEEEQDEEGFQADYSNVGFVANSFNEFLKSLYIENDGNNYYYEENEAEGEYEID